MILNLIGHLLNSSKVMHLPLEDPTSSNCWMKILKYWNIWANWCWYSCKGPWGSFQSRCINWHLPSKICECTNFKKGKWRNVFVSIFCLFLSQCCFCLIVAFVSILRHTLTFYQVFFSILFWIVFFCFVSILY